MCSSGLCCCVPYLLGAINPLCFLISLHHPSEQRHQASGATTPPSHCMGQKTVRWEQADSEQWCHRPHQQQVHNNGRSSERLSLKSTEEDKQTRYAICPGCDDCSVDVGESEKESTQSFLFLPLLPPPPNVDRYELRQRPAPHSSGFGPATRQASGTHLSNFKSG